MLVLLAAVAVAIPAAAALPGDATAQTSDDAAREAAREIQAARDRANAAAEAYFQAQSDLEVLEDDAVGMERRAEALEARVEKLRRDVEAVAVARFATSGAEGIPLLTGLQAPKDQVQADVLVDVVTNAGTSSIDEFQAAQKELTQQQEELARQRQAIEDQQAVFSQLQDDAEAEVQRLREIEEQRLTDEAVRQALAEQQAANLAFFEEVELRNAEAAARAQPNPGIAAAQAAAEAAAAAAADPDADPDADPAIAADAGAGTAPRSTGASGGTSGGRTGTGGAGSVPIGVVNGEVYIDAILCPMNGSAYGDSWGAPRSGGRSHEGVDMLAPMGTPIYAVVSGSVNFRQNRLGGNAVSLVGDNGNRYYYAHLASYEGTSRRVNQGDVIGYNGDTGNATGTPHLHFEVHPGGGLAVNPTPSVRAAGC
ncbi:MAG TPA: peptidoglycan DD-metalloendopeptidase family protein [Ilumatobacteraceae bacterium]|jgi:murein DD-endopeptidase MepM/ murein hydrolase activator NlpD|nr:peptidoglycan DD-metalloendopeptidase family protein [Ilumatobacteraceae bacterium]